MTMMTMTMTMMMTMVVLVAAVMMMMMMKMMMMIMMIMMMKTTAYSTFQFLAYGKIALVQKGQLFIHFLRRTEYHQEY